MNENRTTTKQSSKPHKKNGKAKQRQHTAPHDLWHQDGRAVQGDSGAADLFSSYLATSMTNPAAGSSKKSPIQSLGASKALTISLLTNIILLSVVTFLGVMLFRTNSQKTKLILQTTALSSEIGACEKTKKQMAGELSGCVSDVDNLSGQMKVAAQNNAQDSLLNEHKRLKRALERKVVVENRLEELYIRFFDQFHDIRNYQDLRRKTWRNLRKDAKRRQKLIIQLGQATATYEMVLTAAAASRNEGIKEPDSRLLERNRQRASFVEKILISSESTAGVL